MTLVSDLVYRLKKQWWTTAQRNSVKTWLQYVCYNWAQQQIKRHESGDTGARLTKRSTVLAICMFSTRVGSQQRQINPNKARMRQHKHKQSQPGKRAPWWDAPVSIINVLLVLVWSCSLSLCFSAFFQVSLRAAVLLVSLGLSVRGGFVTTTAWMGERVTSLRGTSQCAAVWQNIPGTVVFTVSPAPITLVAANATNDYCHVLGFPGIHVSLSSPAPETIPTKHWL